MKTCSEIVDEVLEMGDPQGNQEALAKFDASEVDTYIKQLEEQIEDTEYWFYNSDDWIDDLISGAMDQVQSELLNAKGGLTEGDITDIIETHTKRMQGALNRMALEVCNEVKKVYE